MENRLDHNVEIILGKHNSRNGKAGEFAGRTGVSEWEKERRRGRAGKSGGLPHSKWGTITLYSVPQNSKRYR